MSTTSQRTNHVASSNRISTMDPIGPSVAPTEQPRILEPWINMLGPQPANRAEFRMHTKGHPETGRKLRRLRWSMAIQIDLNRQVAL